MNMKLPHPIPYQGSKRNLASRILRLFPNQFERLIEPFAGSAAISIASAYYFKANRFLINDLNSPLICLWNNIINNPQTIIKAYHDIWYGQIGNEEEYYYKARDIFNKTKNPAYLLFLLAKCVKAAVRYNAQGDFNQSPDNRRLGRNPQMMRNEILRVSNLLKGKTELMSTEYLDILDISTANDLIYLDPPYQGTGLNGGFNYSSNIDFDNFVFSLFEINYRDVPFILSFDGRTGDKIHGNPLPADLNLTKIEVNAGRSSQSTLLNRNETTFESIYISSSLLKKIDLQRILNTEMTQISIL